MKYPSKSNHSGILFRAPPRFAPPLPAGSWLHPGLCSPRQRRLPGCPPSPRTIGLPPSLRWRYTDRSAEEAAGFRAVARTRTGPTAFGPAPPIAAGGSAGQGPVSAQRPQRGRPGTRPMPTAGPAWPMPTAGPTQHTPTAGLARAMPTAGPPLPLLGRRLRALRR